MNKNTKMKKREELIDFHLKGNALFLELAQ